MSATEPEVIPWPELQKRAEREGIDIGDYITSMHAHILNQRDALARLNREVPRLQAENLKLSTALDALYTNEKLDDDDPRLGVARALAARALGLR